MTEALTIQQVSRLTGLSVTNLRYYEEIALIDPVPRDESSGHRRYPPDMVERIESLAHLRAAGLPIDAMRTLIAARGHGPQTIATKIHLLETHREQVDTEIQALLARRDYLDNRIAHWRARLADDPAAADALDDQAGALVERLA
ncbi:MerR family transcriptional regulator [Actinoplanes sp. TBRC 11911]|uniref:MerR family transcriptional regulator n=1 Tax=Actinoplanes sp. TBRC 11911 TaxID=2729386 RepID=UPI00145CDE59|nr:MerR family transcriptional regulator [Actinoplanes sp. TBRC 11911]NMO50082.1 MerR family transcriptional regulator [Actinoplanes sp. TBRC 11911]